MGKEKKMVQRSATNKYCLLRYDQTLRIAVQLGLKKSGLTITKLSEETGIGRTQINKYLKGNVIKSVTQWQLMQICQRLGIEVSIKIEFVQ